MYRFAASKFKNTTPKLPKKEDIIFDLPTNVLSCTNNGIHVSKDYIAFCIDGEGGKLGVLPVGTKGRHLRKDIGIVCAHGDICDDFCFLNFDANKLVSCSKNDKVKLWSLSSSGDSVNTELVSQVDVHNGALIEALAPHTTASAIVAAASHEAGYILDVSQEKVVLEVSGVVDRGQSVAWSTDGKLLAISGDKGRQAFIYDPRAQSTPIQTLTLHGGMGREGRLLFCDDKLMSTGFTNKRVQEVILVDQNNWSTVHVQEFVSTTGVLIPHYDPDSKLVFLAGKGTNKLFMMETQQKAPILSSVYEMTLPEQTLGSAIGSKLSVNAMVGEVDTFYQLTKTAIMPIPCIVPRRSYRDFHADLFPDTIGQSEALSAANWLIGDNALPQRVSLAPANGHAHAEPPKATVVPPEPKEVAPLAVKTESRPKVEVKELDYHKSSEEKTAPTLSASTSSSGEESHAKENENPSPPRPTPVQQTEPVVKLRNGTGGAIRSFSFRTDPRPKSTILGKPSSKFRHIETLVGLKANHTLFTNLRNVNTRLPPECNGACASGQFVAVPLSGPAGVIGIYNVDQAEKLPDGVMDGIFNKAQVTDLKWNPFDDCELAVGTDAGILNIWKLSREDGLRNELEPAKVILTGGEKVICIAWHPLASNLMAIALSDNSIELWDTTSCSKKLRIVSHTKNVLSMAWSASGRYLASVGKDLLLNVHQPQLGTDCLIHQAPVLDSAHSARVLYVCGDAGILVSSRTKYAQRQISLFNTENWKQVATLPIDSATQPLIPYYDFDTSILFLSGKGDQTLRMFEIMMEEGHSFLELTDYRGVGGAQAIAFHNKAKCDVMAVEVQRGWRLTEKTLELMIFRVPRIKKDVFQSELFPEALITWEPVVTADEWLAGSDAVPKKISLRPDGVSATVVQKAVEPVPVRRSTFTDSSAKDATEEQVKKQVENSWSDKIVTDNHLEQDHMEGVHEEEWSH